MSSSGITVPEGIDAGLAWHFGNPVAEQRAIESGEARIDLSNREVVTITGPDRASWLHSLTTQHLSGISAGESATALLLDANGHITHVLHLVDDGHTTWVWTEPGAGDALADFLNSMRFMLRVEVARRPDVRVAWLGDQLPDPDAVVASRASQIGRGREVFLAHDDAPTRVELPAAHPVKAIDAGVWAFEAVRIAAGVVRIGVDTDARTIPNEIGLYGTHLNKGCYPGQETVGRVHTLGRPPRRLVQLLLDGSMDALPAPGSAMTADGRPVGIVGSSARHHELGPVALGLVKRGVPTAATLLVDGIAASQEVLVSPDVGLHVRPEVSREARRPHLR